MINCIITGIDRGTSKTVYAKVDRNGLRWGVEDHNGDLTKNYSLGDASKIRIDSAARAIDNFYHGSRDEVNASRYWVRDIKIEVIEG